MSDYIGTVTNAGLAKLAASIGGSALNLSIVRVGDGNGAPITPNPAMTDLVRRVGAAYPIVSSGRDPVNANHWRVTALIPVDDGPFDIREIGVWDAAGEMIAVARHVLVEKRTPAQGAAVELLTDIVFPVSETAHVTVQVTPAAQVSIFQMLRAGFTVAESATLADPPGAPALGRTHVVPAGATGAWNGLAGYLVQWNGIVWVAVNVPAGFVVVVQDKAVNDPARWLRRAATGWETATASSSAFGVARAATDAELTAGTGPGFVTAAQAAGAGLLPLTALPFPEVYTADKMVPISVGMKAGQGGYVLLMGGEVVTLGRGVGGDLGMTRRALVPATDFGWTNANHLAANATYYLRAHLDADFRLVTYLQRGADADAAPPSWLGTPGAAAGGGFDSTRTDMLLARIVTGAAGTVPVLTRYANAAVLSLNASRSTPTLGSTTGVNTIWSAGGESVYVSASGGVVWTLRFALGWARKPAAVMLSGAYQVGTATAEQYISGYSGVLGTNTVSRDVVEAFGSTDYWEANVWDISQLRWTNHRGDLRLSATV